MDSPLRLAVLRISLSVLVTPSKAAEELFVVDAW